MVATVVIASCCHLLATVAMDTHTLYVGSKDHAGPVYRSSRTMKNSGKARNLCPGLHTILTTSRRIPFLNYSADYRLCLRMYFAIWAREKSSGRPGAAPPVAFRAEFASLTSGIPSLRSLSPLVVRDENKMVFFPRKEIFPWLLRV